MKKISVFLFIIMRLNAQVDIVKKELILIDPSWKDAQIRIQSTYYDNKLKLTHYYFQELVKDKVIYPVVYSLHLNQDEKIVHSNLSKPVFLSFNLTANQNLKSTKGMIRNFLVSHQVENSFEVSSLRSRNQLDKIEYSIVGNQKSRFWTQECYYISDGKWYDCLQIILDKDHLSEYWMAYIDRKTGKKIFESNLNMQCGIDIGSAKVVSRFNKLETEEILSNSCYRVYPLPIESPYHGNRSLINSPWLKATNASPLGWHNDGQFNYLSSEGNNVDAYEDMDGDNLPTGGDAARAKGGSLLNFDFNYDTTVSPPLNKNASITNLFYWSNIMHDVWYQYGFDEPAGNMQYNNFNKGGLDWDNVISEGLDNINVSRNNANFSCPPDGYPGRLQMYVWQVPTYDTIIIEQPGQIAGKMVCVNSAISPNLLGPMTGELALVNDGSSFPTQGCNAYINGLQVSGKIALLDKGICNLNIKITQAQNAGAIAMIIINVDDNEPNVMGGFSTGVGIPVMNISKANGDILKANINQHIQLTLLPSSAYKFRVNGKSYLFARAAFGARIPSILQANNIKVLDDQGNLNDACDNILTNINGSIAFIENGNCEPSYKAYQAQQKGALAVVIGMNISGKPIVFPPGTYGSLVNIPVICISQSDYQEILNSIPSTGRFTNTLPQLVDADFDGGIISHEYGHGISIRLTGGPNNNQCLVNAEQAGEGWSDYFALAMTMKNTDLAYQNRGLGTWPSGQSNVAVGIRPFPYNVDLNVNPANYGMMTDQVKISLPHGIGFIWCSMIWDMTWALIKQYGFESDIYLSNSNRGNIKAFNLIMSGLKLQVCNPGFVDSRNAILKSDTILNGGVNACLIWNIFARRGLGYSANQGSSFFRDDGIPATDLPPGCFKMTDSQLFGNSSLDNSAIILSGRIENEHAHLEWEFNTQEKLKSIELIRKDELNKDRVIYSGLPEPQDFIDTDLISNQVYKYKLNAYTISNQWIESNWINLRNAKDQDWELFPNPAKTELFLQNRSIQKSIVKLELMDIQNKLMDQNEFFINRNEYIKLDISNLSPGVYFIKISSELESRIMKFIKE